MEQAFLQAILERPMTDDSYLVMADWLEENGHGPRSELVRLQVRLRQELRVRQRSADEKRLQQLLAAGARPPIPIVTNSIGMRLALIPPGVFFMGSPSRRLERDDDDEFPRRLVRITRPFLLGTCQVTQGQYETVIGNNPSYFGPSGGGVSKVGHLDQRSLPVENISFVDTEHFCQRISALEAEREARRVYRLPTEAEWEYACRACICHTAYWVGSRLRTKHARFGAQGGGHPMPVGIYPPNAFGIHDTHGNVWEWCSDWYDSNYYSSGPESDPVGPPVGNRRVLRGGGWSTTAPHCRSANRGHNTLEARHNYNGFRVAVSVPT